MPEFRLTIVICVVYTKSKKICIYMFSIIKSDSACRAGGRISQKARRLMSPGLPCGLHDVGRSGVARWSFNGSRSR
ncbi:hypothetical protein CHELA1G11_11390 [Hyphomicrobiales bacterium]|nr:hypothetical protein CHELA1G11_11390 [Hyphomicrobiales bacterium]CAH1668098.1 hypothetical protein CHELA1G2_12919 [Hyphomicrobiales bacterium]